MSSRILTTYKEEFKKSKFRIRFLITLVFSSVVYISFTDYLTIIEQRPGVIINDPILNLFQPVDLTWPLFILLYSAVLLNWIDLLQKPAYFVRAFFAYTVMVVFRWSAMYLMPFDPPPDMIPLVDPLIKMITTGELLTRDLFFSGHTATGVVLFLTVRNKVFKSIILICTVMVAIFVILQHVHYTVDVLCAPPFAYLAYKIAEKLIKV